MKLATVTGSVSRLAGGMFTSIRRLQQERLRQFDVEIRVFGLEDRHSGDDLSTWSPVRTEAFPVLGPAIFGWAPRMFPALRRFDPDVVHVHGIWMHYSTVNARLSRRRGTPYVVHPHGMLDEWAVRRSSWKKRVARLLYENEHLRKASCIRALCTAEADALREFGLRGRVCIIPNGIDLPQERARGPWAWPGIVEPGRKVLLFLSRVHEKKGLPHLITAWSGLLARDRPLADEWSLVIAGWDTTNHEVALRRMVRELRLEDSVKFVGPLFDERKDEALRHASAFILPSFSEGLPMTVLEGWAYSLPVIMTPQCNLPEGFQAEAAIRVEPAPVSIENGLRELMTMSVQQRAVMGDRGRRLVRERYQWDVIASQVHAVDEWILGGGAPPPSVL